jgi:hypothetical protein
MPVTARLSRAFYDQFGDAIANELVEWFNAVDLTYRTELRELNELNFARFEAKVGERFAELRAEIEVRFSLQNEKLAALRVELLDGIRETKLSLLRWMFGFWVGTAGLILGSRLVQ